MGAGKTGAEGFQNTQGGHGRTDTNHGAQRIKERNYTDDDLSRVMSSDIVKTQKDGAKVFIEKTSSGKYNIVVQNPTTGKIITVFKTIGEKALERLAKRYGWR